MELKQEYLDVLERLGWYVRGGEEDKCVELETYSPAGEYFSICVKKADFVQKVLEQAESFDEDEHVAMRIEARRNGIRNVPSNKELVRDGSAVKRMLQELADGLLAADGKGTKQKPMGKDEFRNWIYENYIVPGDNCTLAPDMLDGILDYAEKLGKEDQREFFETVFPAFSPVDLDRVYY